MNLSPEQRQGILDYNNIQDGSHLTEKDFMDLGNRGYFGQNGGQTPGAGVLGPTGPGSSILPPSGGLPGGNPVQQPGGGGYQFGGNPIGDFGSGNPLAGRGGFQTPGAGVVNPPGGGPTMMPNDPGQDGDPYDSVTQPPGGPGGGGGGIDWTGIPDSMRQQFLAQNPGIGTGDSMTGFVPQQPGGRTTDGSFDVSGNFLPPTGMDEWRTGMGGAADVLDRFGNRNVDVSSRFMGPQGMDEWTTGMGGAADVLDRFGNRNMEFSTSFTGSPLSRSDIVTDDFLNFLNRGDTNLGVNFDAKTNQLTADDLFKLDPSGRMGLNVDLQGNTNLGIDTSGLEDVLGQFQQAGQSGPGSLGEYNSQVAMLDEIFPEGGPQYDAALAGLQQRIVRRLTPGMIQDIPPGARDFSPTDSGGDSGDGDPTSGNGQAPSDSNALPGQLDMTNKLNPWFAGGTKGGGSNYHAALTNLFSQMRDASPEEMAELAPAAQQLSTLIQQNFYNENLPNLTQSLQDQYNVLAGDASLNQVRDMIQGGVDPVTGQRTGGAVDAAYDINPAQLMSDSLAGVDMAFGERRNELEDALAARGILNSTRGQDELNRLTAQESVARSQARMQGAGAVQGMNSQEIADQINRLQAVENIYAGRSNTAMNPLTALLSALTGNNVSAQALGPPLPQQQGGGLGGALGGIAGGLAGSFLGPLGAGAGSELGKNWFD